MASNPASCCLKPVMCHFYVRDAGYFTQNPASQLDGDLCCLRVHLDTFVTKQSCEPSIQLAGLALRGWPPYLPASVTSSAICICRHCICRHCIYRHCIYLHILRNCTRSGQNQDRTFSQPAQANLKGLRCPAVQTCVLYRQNLPIQYFI